MRIISIISVPAMIFMIVSCGGGKNIMPDDQVKTQGEKVIAQTFDTLRSTLLNEIRNYGFAGAVEFCNTNALTLTNTYASENIFVKRTSGKLRNMANAPDSMEQRILALYWSLKSNGKELKPVIEKDDVGNQHYFKPIIIQAMCLNCHGDKNTQIQPATWQTIQLKYPSDAAWDYEEGDLRGIWHVKFMAAKK